MLNSKIFDSVFTKFFISCLFFSISFAFLDGILFLFGVKSFYFSQNVLIPLIVGLASGLFISFIFIEPSFKSNANIKFEKSFGRLLGEIKYNRDMASAFCLNNYIHQAQEKWSNKEAYWIPEKHPSFTPWSNFFYQYFPTDAYYYFINQEFIIDNRLRRGLLSAMGRFYSSCFNFSHLTQIIENDINTNLNFKTPEQIRGECQKIKIIAENFFPKIEAEYNGIMNDDSVKNFIALHPDLFTYE